MSIINDYVSERRQKKIEELNQALEHLKRENVANTDIPQSRRSPPYASPSSLKSGKDLLFIGILLVCVVVLIIITFYYRSQASHLADNYNQKVTELKTLQEELDQKLTDLNQTKDLLKTKEATEKDLSGEKEKLNASVTTLQDQIAALKVDIAAKTDQLTNLTRTLADQKAEISDWKNCILDKYAGNLSVCGV